MYRTAGFYRRKTRTEKLLKEMEAEDRAIKHGNSENTGSQESNRIVFFGGAGVSTESGIPDFRSVDGLYHQKFDYPPEVIISHSFYERNPEYFLPVLPGENAAAGL